jgi:Zn-dependent membrane protease YugP
MVINKLRFLADTKKCLVIDETDYAALGIDVVAMNAKLLGTIGGPSTAVVVKESAADPLIDLVIATQSSEFALPLANGAILNGDYTLNTQLNMSRSDMTTTIVGPNYVRVFGFDLSGLESGDSITISGSVTPSNNGVKTITGVSYISGGGGFSLITVSGPSLTTDATGDIKSSFNVTRTGWFSELYNYSGCNIVALSTNVVYDCTSTQFGSIYFYDTTILPIGQTLTERFWNIEYPSNLNPPPTSSPISSPSQNVFLYELATGPWGYRLDYTVQVDQDDNLQVYYSSTTGSQNVTVSCSGDICSILECYKLLVARADQDIAANGASALSGTLLLVNSYLEIASNQRACGDEAGFCATIDVVKGLIDASGTCTCGCTDNPGNAWVNNAGASSQTQIETMAAEIAVLQDEMVVVQGQAETAINDSANALSIATSVQADVVTAQETADSALSAANAAQATADSKVASVTGALVDNTDPQNPVINQTYFDEDQFIGNGIETPISLDALDASHVNITPPILGLTATNGQAAFSELKSKTAIAQLTANNALTAANTAQTAANNAQNTADLKVASVTGALVDNTDPQNPVINQTYFDEDQFIGNGIETPISLDALDASHVNVNPVVAGWPQTGLQALLNAAIINVPAKIYMVRLYQTATNAAPNMEELFDTAGQSFTISRSGPGNYSLVPSAGTINYFRSFAIISNAGATNVASTWVTQYNSIQITFASGGVLADDLYNESRFMLITFP